MITNEERQALDRLGSGTEEEAAEAAAVLARGCGDEVDRELLELLDAAADWSHSPEAKISQKVGWHEHASLNACLRGGNPPLEKIWIGER